MTTTTNLSSEAAAMSRPFGLWDSPITPLSLAQGLRLSDVQWDTDGDALVWLEGRSDRGVLVATVGTDQPQAPRDLTSSLSVRATVGYGGGDFTVAHGHVYFVSGGRLYRQALAGGSARPITPAFGALAAPRVSPDGRWVLFVHTYEDQDVLAVIDSEGAGWPVKLAAGRDFYMQPAWHPGGRQIAWIAWDHPNMPWDGTELWMAAFECDEQRVTGDGATQTGPGVPRLSNARRVAGGPDVSIVQPEFTPDGLLVYVSDENGWGQIFIDRLQGSKPQRLTDGTGEYSRPAWVQGQRSFAVLGDGSGLVAVRSEYGFHRLQLVRFDGAVRDLEGESTSYTVFDQPHAGRRSVACIASAPGIPARVVSFAIDTGRSRVWARSMGESVAVEGYATPRSVTWPTGNGEVAHGLFFPPHNPRFTSPGLPPLVVQIHGGPTSQVTAGFAAQTQFFTSRGYAVLQVNYRGSTGYGREYMLKLRGNWGLHDMEDARTGALYLVEQGLVHPARRVIMGGSAGGYTVLQSLVHHPGFYTAGICLFGVSNQFTLATDTHKFEARYLDSMIGPLPEAAPLYRERSPLFFVDRIKDPVAVFQGDIDQVVPREQSDTIVASLRARGVPHEYHVYEGEGHGWRRSDTIEKFYTSVERFLRQWVVFA